MMRRKMEFLDSWWSSDNRILMTSSDALEIMKLCSDPLHPTSSVVLRRITLYVMHLIQGGKDAQDAFSCKSLSEKVPQIMGLFGGK